MIKKMVGKPSFGVIGCFCPQGSLLAQRVFEEEAATHNKSVTAAEAFRARAPVRKLLQAQCEERPRDCVHYDASTSALPLIHSLLF